MLPAHCCPGQSPPVLAAMGGEKPRASYRGTMREADNKNDSSHTANDAGRLGLPPARRMRTEGEVMGTHSQGIAAALRARLVDARAAARTGRSIKRKSMANASAPLALALVAAALCGLSSASYAARDPGVRRGDAGAGG